jgi:site-specific DNA-methyltransferase (adenine-specific)
MNETAHPIAPVVDVDVGWPVLHPQNPRKGDVAAITDLIRINGWHGVLVIQRSTRHVLVGNHRLQAARALGYVKVPAMIVDVDDDHAMRILLSDNRASDLAVNDEHRLAEILTAVATTTQGLAGTGYDQQAFADAISALAQPPQRGEDEVPPVLDDAVSVPGEVYELGEHRVICGDSTKPETLARLFDDGAVADMIWTDPPYGIAYKGGIAKPRAAIANDDLTAEDLRAFLEDAFDSALPFLKPGGACYVAAPQGENFVDFGLVLRARGLYRQVLVWRKNQMVLGRSDYHYIHEPIFYGWKPGAAHFFVDDRTQTSVHDVDRPMRSPDHPTMKPPELIERHVVNSSRPGEIVLDVFGGSGSTMIAAAQSGRRARLVEFEPRYVDVIRRRWTVFARSVGREPGAHGLEPVRTTG